MGTRQNRLANQIMICPAVLSIHTVCYSDTQSICAPYYVYYDIVYEMSVLGSGYIQNVKFDKRRTVLVGRRSRCQHFISQPITLPTSGILYSVILTHLSLASFMWDIGKQNSPRCDAAERGVPSGAILFAYRIFIEKLKKKNKNHS